MPVYYTADQIPGWLSKNEGQLLAYFAKRANGPIVEIGSFQGKSTIYMAKVAKQIIYSVDPHLGRVSSLSQPEKHHRLRSTFSSFQKNLKRFGVESKVVSDRKTSAAANKGWTRPIALLHIDGLHEYEHVKKDLRLWLPHLKDGGVVVCHDAFCLFPDVFKAVNEEIFQKGQWKYLGALDSQIFAVKGKPENIWQTINFSRQKNFLTLASTVWHNQSLPENLRFFIVNRLLKITFLNRYMTDALLKKLFLS